MPRKSFLHSTAGKVILAFLVACVAFTLAWRVMHRSFSGVLQTVDQLSTPNEKLKVINELFQGITQLDQLQRQRAVNDQKKLSRSSLRQSRFLQQNLDSLAHLSEGDTLQVMRIDSMKKLLRSRDALFGQYQQLRSDIVHNKSLSKQIKSLSELVASSAGVMDSSVITTQQTITTTLVNPSTIGDSAFVTPEPQGNSFWNRLFGKKKEVARTPLQKIVNEELRVKIDTLTVAQQDSVIAEIEGYIQQIQFEQESRSTDFIDKELTLIGVSGRINRQLLTLLHEVEKEELKQVKQSNAEAASVVENGFKNIQLIFILFFLVAGCLVLLVIFDIGKSNRYRKALQAAKEEAERLSQVKQQFLSNMSHELRTPLQSVIGFAEQAAHQQPAQPQTLKAIQRSASHLLDVVNEVLDYNRIVSGRFSFSPKPFGLETLLQEIIAVMEPAALKKGLQLRLHHNLRKDQMYFADGFRLRQILYNLLGNAIKFTDTGYVLLKVIGESEGNMDRIHFEITDTGIGISEAQQAVIFNAFEQANGSIAAAYGGTGLGLSIVKALVEQQNGVLEIESEPEKGTTFRITLQMLRVQGTLADGAPVLVAPENTSPMKVTVIDDDELILQLCGMILSRHHIPHELVYQPQRWLQELKENDFTHALVDMRMPVMSGVDVCHILKERFGDKITVIALTAQVLPEERNSVLEQGFDGLLCKPFREEELMQTLRQLHGALQQEWIGEADMDLSAVMEMTGGDEQLLEGYLRDWHRDTETDLGLLQVHLSAQNHLQAREVVHRLAGRVGMLGNGSLHKQLRQAEQQLATQMPGDDQLQPLVKELQQMLQKVKALLELQQS